MTKEQGPSWSSPRNSMAGRDHRVMYFLVLSITGLFITALKKAKTAIILATIFHEKMQCYVLLAKNYIPVTLLRNSDIEMRKLDPKGCGSLNESLWGSRGASGGKRVQRP